MFIYIIIFPSSKLYTTKMGIDQYIQRVIFQFHAFLTSSKFSQSNKLS